MEKENRSGDNEVKSEERKRTEYGGERAGGNSNTANAGTRTGTRTGNAAGTEEKEKILPKVVAITPPEPKKRKRTTKKAAAKTEENETSKQLSAFLVGVSSIAASRPNMNHWLITDKEAKTIAEPLANIIEKSETMKKVAEHGDAMALVVACMTVFAPRVIITTEKIKEKKKLQKKGVQVVERKETEAPADNRKSNTKNANDGTNVNPAIYGILQPADGLC